MKIEIFFVTFEMLMPKKRCYKEGAQHVFDFHCGSHSQMFSYHHVTYIFSNGSLDIWLPQKSSDRSNVLFADFENSRS